MANPSNTAAFIAKAQVVHGPDRYSYDRVDYRTAIIKVIIDCPEHGSFEQTPNAHLSGRGCSICGKKRSSLAQLKTAALFFAQATDVHQGKYAYLISDYKSTGDPISIICPLHGAFQQLAANHLKGHGCAQCGSKITSAKKLKGLPYFLAKAHALFGTHYDYRKVAFTKMAQLVTIICPVHGDFQKPAGAHLRGSGCQKCSARVHRAASRSGWLEVQKGRKALLYVVELSNREEVFYKAGITFDLAKRFHSTRMPYAWRVVGLYESDDAAMIYNLEKHLHRQLIRFRYRPQIAFGGHMECYVKLQPILALLPAEAMVKKEWTGWKPTTPALLPRQLTLL